MALKKTKKVSKKAEEPSSVCPTCNGTGRDVPEQTCPTCEGTGKAK